MSRKRRKHQRAPDNGATLGLEADPVELPPLPTESPPPLEAPRVRKKGEGPTCEKCGGDMFVEDSRAYPAFMASSRLRRYRCGTCKDRTKRAIPREPPE